MIEVSDEVFEELVADALSRVPERFVDEIENVVFLVEDEPEDNPGTLGLYHGVSLLDRAEYYNADLPDTITIYQGPHERMCLSEDDLAEQVFRTVVHEIGHYFGMSEEEIAEMGYA